MRWKAVSTAIVLAGFLAASAAAQDQIRSGSITSTTCPGTGCLELAVAGGGTGAIQLSGTWTATAQFEGSACSSGTPFVSLAVYPLAGGAGVTSSTASGAWLFSAAGLCKVRVRASAYTSGTVDAAIRVSPGTALSPSSSGGGSGDGAILDGANPALKATVTAANALKVDNSGVVQFVSASSSTWPPTGDVTATGTITNTSTCPGVGCIFLTQSGAAGFAVHIDGTWTGQIALEASFDATNFFQPVFWDSVSWSQASTVTTNGDWVIHGYRAVRARASSWTSGTANVHIRASNQIAAPPVAVALDATQNQIVDWLAGSNGPIAVSDSTVIDNQTNRSQKTQITDGTRDGTVKAASTSPSTADTAFVVGLSPNGNQATAANQTNGSQKVQLTDAGAHLTTIQNTVPVNTDYGLVVRNIPGTVPYEVTTNGGEPIALDSTATQILTRIGDIDNGLFNGIYKIANVNPTRTSGSVSAGGVLTVSSLASMGSVFVSIAANATGASTFVIEASGDAAASWNTIPAQCRTSASSTWLPSPNIANLALSATESAACYVNVPGGVTDIRLRRTDANPGTNAVVAAPASESHPYFVTATTDTQGNAGSNAQGWWTRIGDGTNGPAAVKPASTAAAAADPSLVVALSPNSPLPTGSNAIGTVTANIGTTNGLALDATLTALRDAITSTAVSGKSLQDLYTLLGSVISQNTHALVVTPAVALPLPPCNPIRRYNCQSKGF